MLVSQLGIAYDGNRARKTHEPSQWVGSSQNRLLSQSLILVSPLWHRASFRFVVMAFPAGNWEERESPRAQLGVGGVTLDITGYLSSFKEISLAPRQKSLRQVSQHRLHD